LKAATIKTLAVSDATQHHARHKEKQIRMNITIYHNPRCSKSRQTLELLENRGITPRIVAYLEDAPSADELRRISTLLDAPVSSFLRRGDDDAKALDEDVIADDARLADWLHDHPRAIERPIVVNEDKNEAAIGRPPENVLPLLSP